jgi:hypothetical protein
VIASSLVVQLAELEEDAAAVEEGEETVNEGPATLVVDGTLAVEGGGVDTCSAACVFLTPYTRCIPNADSRLHYPMLGPTRCYFSMAYLLCTETKNQ